MHEIKYSIELNEQGRPVIGLPLDYDENPENKFFAMELSRTYMNSVYNNMNPKIFDNETINKLYNTVQVMSQICDEMARIIFDSMIAMGDADICMGNYCTVANIEERNRIDRYYVTNGRIFRREIGFKVLVSDTNVIYELKKGITNDDWELFIANTNY